MPEVNVRSHFRRTKSGGMAPVRQTQRTVDARGLITAIARQMAQKAKPQPAQTMQSSGEPPEPSLHVPTAEPPAPAPGAPRETHEAGHAVPTGTDHHALKEVMATHLGGHAAIPGNTAELVSAVTRAIEQHQAAGGRVKHVRFEGGQWRTSNTKPAAEANQPLLHIASGQVKLSIGGKVVHSQPLEGAPGKTPPAATPEAATPIPPGDTPAAPKAEPGAPKALKTATTKPADAAKKPRDPKGSHTGGGVETGPATGATVPEPAAEVPKGVHLDGKHEPHVEPPASPVTPEPAATPQPHTTGGGEKAVPVIHPIGPVNEPGKAIDRPSVDIHAPLVAIDPAVFAGKGEAHAARIRRYEAAKQHLGKIAEKRQLEGQLFGAEGPDKHRIKEQLKGYVAYTPEVELKVRQSLHAAMRPMLHGIAGDYIRKLGMTPTLDAKGRPEASSFYGDLSQAAMEHAWEVVARHDPLTHKTALEDQVRGTVTKELSQRWRNVLGLTSVSVSPTEHRNLRQMAKMRGALVDHLGREPHDAEVAEAMGIKVKDVEHLRDLAGAVAAARLDAKVGEDENSATLGDTVASHTLSPERILLRKEAESRLHDKVSEAIGRIEDPRIRHALILEYGIDDENASLIAMAQHLGIPELARALKTEQGKDASATPDELVRRALVATGTRAIKLNENSPRYKLGLKLIEHKLDPVKMLTTPDPGKDKLTPTDLFQRLGYDEGFGRKMSMHGRNAIKADEAIATFARKDIKKGWTSSILWSPERRLYRHVFMGEAPQPHPQRIVKAWMADASLVKSLRGADNVFTVLDMNFNFGWQMAAFDVDDQLAKGLGTEMEKAHPGGRWVTMHGRHIYISKDGMIQAGPVDFVGKHIDELHAHIVGGGEIGPHSDPAGEVQFDDGHHVLSVGGKTVHVKVREDHVPGGEPKLRLHSVVDEHGKPVDVKNRGANSFAKLYEHLGFTQKSEGGKAVSHNMAKQFAIAMGSGDTSAKVAEQVGRLGTNKGVREKEGKVLSSTLTGDAKKEHAARNAPVAFAESTDPGHAEHAVKRYALGAKVDDHTQAMLKRFHEKHVASEANDKAIAAHGADSQEAEHTREQLAAAAGNFAAAHSQLKGAEHELEAHEAATPSGDRTFTATMHGGHALDIHVGSDGRVKDGGYWGEMLGNTLIHSADDLNRKLKSLEGQESKVHLTNGGNHWLLNVRYDGKGTPVITSGALAGQRLHEVIGQNGGLKSTQAAIEHDGKKLYPGYDTKEGRTTALGNWSREKAHEHFGAETDGQKAEIDRKIDEADAGAGPEMPTVALEKEGEASDATLTLPGDPKELDMASKLVERYGNLKSITGKHLEAIAAEHGGADGALAGLDGTDQAAKIHELLRVARVLHGLKEEGYGDLVEGKNGRSAIRLPISAVDHVAGLLGGVKLKGGAMARLQQHRQHQAEAADVVNNFDKLGSQAYGPEGRAENAIPGLFTHKNGDPNDMAIGFTKHQQKAIHQYIHTKRMISALGVGSGKTSSALAAAEHAMVHDPEAPKKYVVVVPTQQQAGAWKKDAKEFFGMTAHDPDLAKTGGHDPNGAISFGNAIGPDARYHVVTRAMLANPRTRVGGHKVSALLKAEGKTRADLADPAVREQLAAKHGFDPAELVSKDGKPAAGSRMVGRKPIAQHLKENGFDGMIVDEAHTLNNASQDGGKQRRVVDAYAHGMDHAEAGLTAAHGKVKGMMALTGTPIQNHPGEQFNLVQMTHRGEHDLGTQKRFLDTYMRKDTKSGQYIGVKKDKSAELGNKLARYMVSSSAADLNAEIRPPSASIEEEHVHLGPEHDAMLRRHDQMMRETGANNLIGASDQKSKGGALAAINQIEEEMHGHKVAHAEQLMRHILAGDPHAKVILSSRWVGGQDKLQAMVKRVLGEYDGKAAAHLAGAFDSIHDQVRSEMERHHTIRQDLIKQHADTRDAHEQTRAIHARQAEQGGGLSQDDQAALEQHAAGARVHADAGDRLANFPDKPDTVRELEKSADRIKTLVGSGDAARLGYQHGVIRASEEELNEGGDATGKRNTIDQKKRNDAVTAFNNDESHKALVVSANIAASGVNLGRGTHLIDLDGDYNQANLEQLYGRPARLTGSVPKAIIHPIIAKSATAGVPTLDERKQDAVTRKKAVATEVRDAARGGRIPDVAANPVRIKPHQMGVTRAAKGSGVAS